MFLLYVTKKQTKCILLKVLGKINVGSKAQIILVLGELNDKCIRNILKYQILLANFGIVDNLSTVCNVEIHSETLEDM